MVFERGSEHGMEHGFGNGLLHCFRSGFENGLAHECRHGLIMDQIKGLEMDPGTGMAMDVRHGQRGDLTTGCSRALGWGRHSFKRCRWPQWSKDYPQPTLDGGQHFLHYNHLHLLKVCPRPPPAQKSEMALAMCCVVHCVPPWLRAGFGHACSHGFEHELVHCPVV